MQLLAKALAGSDVVVATLYKDLAAAEARHQGLYLGLARSLFGEETTDARQREVFAHEAEVIGRFPGAPRLHA
jgi:tRNA isopentenyl-2-thiomethyl-A-37 hydroxylase MiaE